MGAPTPDVDFVKPEGLSLEEEMLWREEVANVSKHWVRTVTACNSHCMFCLDMDTPRNVYLNAWLYVDDGMGGFTSMKVLGTDSGNPAVGPAGYTTKPSGGATTTVAFNPDTFPLGVDTFTFDVDFPPVPAPTPAILRLRLDYGEDAGELSGMHCFSDASLSGACGKALFGEVEDHHTILIP